MVNSIYGDTDWLFYLGTKADAFQASGGYDGVYIQLQGVDVEEGGDNGNKFYHGPSNYDLENKIGKRTLRLDITAKIIKPVSGTGSTLSWADNANAVRNQVQKWWQSGASTLYCMIAWKNTAKTGTFVFGGVTYKAGIDLWTWQMNNAECAYMKCGVKNYKCKKTHAGVPFEFRIQLESA